MRYLRTLPTSRLLAALSALSPRAVCGGRRWSRSLPVEAAARRLRRSRSHEALHDSLAGPPVDGVTARVTFTNKLFPSGALLGSAGPVLMSGGSGRLWLTSDGHGRIELQSNARRRADRLEPDCG